MSSLKTAMFQRRAEVKIEVARWYSDSSLACRYICLSYASALRSGYVFEYMDSQLAVVACKAASDG